MVQGVAGVALGVQRLQQHMRPVIVAVGTLPHADPRDAEVA